MTMRFFRVLVLGLLSACFSVTVASAAEESGPPVKVVIDHFVLAVSDMERGIQHTGS